MLLNVFQVESIKYWYQREWWYNYISIGLLGLQYLRPFLTKPVASPGAGRYPSGSLSKSEIREGIRLCGHQMKEEELNEIFSALDADGTGQWGYAGYTYFWVLAGVLPAILRNISRNMQKAPGKVHYTEWLAATMKPSTLATDKAIKQAQRTNKLGHLTAFPNRDFSCSSGWVLFFIFQVVFFTCFSHPEPAKGHFFDTLSLSLSRIGCRSQVFHYLDIDQTGLIKPHELFRLGGRLDAFRCQRFPPTTACQGAGLQWHSEKRVGCSRCRWW